MQITSALFLIAGVSAAVLNFEERATSTSTGYVAQISPSFSNLAKPTGLVTSYPSGGYDTSTTLAKGTLSGFPEVWTVPDTNHPEVTAMYNKINWDYVPKATVRPIVDGSVSFAGYSASDPYCWWSYSNCKQPKVSYLPSDIYTCPNSGDYGLSFDDGPLSLEVTAKYGEPTLYNFLVENDQKATLFVSPLFIL